jgi:hypothetical protein
LTIPDQTSPPLEEMRRKWKANPPGTAGAYVNSVIEIKSLPWQIVKRSFSSNQGFFWFPVDPMMAERGGR